MVFVVRLITLFLEGLLQQFINGVGVAALMAALAVGFFRLSWWKSVLILTFIFGFGVEYLFEDWIKFSDKAQSASERWAWMLLIYFFIVFVAYWTGRYGRRHLERRGKAAPQKPHTR
ncbi:hypothetical protein [Methylosinus sp. Ce-a6]|uniref:hypothetical protein n=1 Tax=Methylosinus sp. Ce-a6 TaxID=2172005 RepID=UPI0013583FBE|nr:hypothetical protein [Methylosinus sp. Ce-a6]